MTTPRQIAFFLNKLLRVKKVPDDSKNGLQFDAKRPVTKIALAVDASLSSFKKAVDSGAQLIIVHHGLLWKNQKSDSQLSQSSGM